MTTYRDSSGRTLADYERPSVAVDTAVLTVAAGCLSVLLVTDERGGRRLPGTFLHAGETLADAVRRSLAEKAHVAGLEPRQLAVFDSPGRDPRGWVLSVAHVVAVPAARLPDADLTPVDEVSGLDLDHGAMLELAVAHLRADYRHSPDPWRLLDEPFTLLELERLHRAIDPETALRDAFRRAMEPQLVATGEIEAGTVGKPARLFRRG